MAERPTGCCGVCPPIVGGGYDCTCAGNPRCPKRTPHRIQRKRAAGWRMPEGAIYVGRGSYLGNPYRIYEHCRGPNGDWGIEDAGRFNLPCGHGWTNRDAAARVAVGMYRVAFDEAFPVGGSARYAVLADLRGHDLACWCPLNSPCHADVLLELANRLEGD